LKDNTTRCFRIKKDLTELKRGMEDLRVDVEVAQETVNEAIAEIDADEAAPDANKLKF
jgi:hypothetical protein